MRAPLHGRCPRLLPTPSARTPFADGTSSTTSSERMSVNGRTRRSAVLSEMTVITETRAQPANVVSTASKM